MIRRERMSLKKQHVQVGGPLTFTCHYSCLEIEPGGQMTDRFQAHDMWFPGATSAVGPCILPLLG